MTAVAPVIDDSPTSGAGFGVAGERRLLHRLRRGRPSPSSIVASAIFTTKKQLLVAAKVDTLGVENGSRMTADGRFYNTSQDTFSLGTGTSEDDAVNQQYHFYRVYETLDLRVAPQTYLGGGLLYNRHSDTHPDDDVPEEDWLESEDVAYSQKHGFDLETQTSSGVGANAMFDTRDGTINPSRGWFAQILLTLMFFDGFLGGSSNWQQVSYDARSYRRLTSDGRHKLAFWTFGDLVTGGSAPYLDLPSTAADTYNRSGRGYPQGRFRGEQMVYGEVEYRWTFMKSGLLGMVAFLNTQTLSDETENQKLFDHFEPGGGAGLRVALKKPFKTNLCLDIGVGLGTRGRFRVLPCRKRSDEWKSGSSRVPAGPASASSRSAKASGRCCRSMPATVRCSRPAVRSGFMVCPPLEPRRAAHITYEGEGRYTCGFFSRRRGGTWDKISPWPS